MKKTERSIILFVIFIILGAAIALQVRSTLIAKKQDASNILDADRLMTQLVTEQKAVDELKTAIDENLSLRDGYIKAYIERNMDYETADLWKEMKLKSCFTDVKGPGITIKLDDAAARQEDTPLNWLIIHDQDIKIILNELKKAGAEAIAINGERVVSMSEQVCAGPTIMINGNRYSVPYIIDVIGDPDILYENIINSARIAEMEEYKIRIEILESKELTIRKFSRIDDLDRLISGLEEIVK